MTHCCGSKSGSREGPGFPPPEQRSIPAPTAQHFIQLRQTHPQKRQFVAFAPVPVPGMNRSHCPMPTLKDMTGKAATLACLRPAAAGAVRTRRGEAPPSPPVAVAQLRPELA